MISTIAKYVGHHDSFFIKSLCSFGGKRIVRIGNKSYHWPQNTEMRIEGFVFEDGMIKQNGVITIKKRGTYCFICSNILKTTRHFGFSRRSSVYNPDI